MNVRKFVGCLCFVLLITAFSPRSARAQDEDTTQHAKDEVAVSPKRGWEDFSVVEVPVERPWWHKVLLWVPNRVMDLVDIFHVDVGVGPAYGGVIRVTRYVQAGYRQMAPGSLRVGAMGRRWPIKVESSNEIGFSPAFIQSKDRQICKGELGVGVDLLIVGAYGGICTEEVFDFLAGIFTFDPRDDDIK